MLNERDRKHAFYGSLFFLDTVLALPDGLETYATPHLIWALALCQRQALALFARCISSLAAFVERLAAFGHLQFISFHGLL